MAFTVTALEIPGLTLIDSDVFVDHRGVFVESYREKVFSEDFTVPAFVQGNVSVSNDLVARGLHYQVEKPQGKLMRTVAGRTINVVLDMRAGSKTFGHYTWVSLGYPARALWVPPGFANGFIAMTNNTAVAYECSSYHHVGSDRAVNMQDVLRRIAASAPDELALEGLPSIDGLTLSAKDIAAPVFEHGEPVPESEWRS